MEQHDETTPIDRPLLRSDLNEVREHIRSVLDIQLSMHEELKRLRGPFVLPVAVCVLSALVCLVCVFVVISRVTS